LYKETPVRLLTKQQKALQGKKGRAGEPGWELTASTVEELQALGVKVQRSRDKSDQSLAAAVCTVSLSDSLCCRDVQRAFGQNQS
jgi:hypothetical protein